MGSIPRLVLWLCRKFTRQDLQELVTELQEILAGRQPEPQPRDDFRQQHPHYGDFYVDPQAPLIQPPAPPPPPQPTRDWQQLCDRYQERHGRPLAPVRRQGKRTPPAPCRCAHCGAPRDFLYFNDGRQASQLLCKVCRRLSQLPPRHRPGKTPYWCPYCHSALYRWKQRPDCTLYKCPCDRCPRYLQKQHALQWNEKLLQKLRLSQFKLRYQIANTTFNPLNLPLPLPIGLAST